MHNTLPVLKGFALFAFGLFFVGGFVLEVQVSGTAVRLESQLSTQLRGVNSDVAKAGDVLDRVRDSAGLVNESLRAQPPDKLIHDARLSLDNINRAAIDERLYFEQTAPLLTQQAQGVLQNVQTATSDLHPLMLSAKTSTDAIAPLLRETTARIAAISPLEAHADELIEDPSIRATLDSLAKTSQSTAGTAISVQHIAADGEAEVHKLTHPKPLVSIADWTLKVVHAINPF